MSDSNGLILDKALQINLHPQRYGTFAEIGAGQEVVRWFFRAGGAAGTISKSISAYDMKVSDAIYGKCQRYVCRERLDSMLACEQSLNRDRLAQDRGDSTAFFAFADTVSARNYHGTNECHGWMGIRFQARPGAADSHITIHVRMLDVENSLQQEALGIVGVNLIYAAFFHFESPEKLIQSLLDGLGTDRIEIDMIEFGGAEFERTDNRILTLQLVQMGMTGAAMFGADGTVLQPSAALRKRPLVVERGRFRPVTLVNIDMIDAAIERFERECKIDKGETLPIMELTMHNLTDNGEVCLDDFVSRAEVLASTGYTVMISDFFEYYRLAEYLSGHTQRQIGLAMGLDSLKGLFEERYYENLAGGTLESFGRLFRNQLRLLIYPMKDAETGKIRALDSLNIEGPLGQLFGYLKERGCVLPLDKINGDYLDIHSPDVLRMIACGNDDWETLVPECVAKAIRARGLFGLADQTAL